MEFNPEIFRVYDIRGIYGKDFDDEFAFQLGVTLVHYLNRKKFLVANDGRDFSANLAESLMHGITSAGGDASYLGLSTTPFFNFSFYKLNLSGGVMITASHNGPEYGGFKIFGEDGKPISLVFGLDKIRDLVRGGGFEISKYGGRTEKLRSLELLNKYRDFILKESGVKIGELKNVKAKIEGAGAVMEEIRPVLKCLEIGNHQSGFDVIFKFDGDADRLLVFDGNNNPIRADFIIALILQDSIGFWTKPRLVHDSRFSRGVIEMLDKWGVKNFRSKAGRTFIREEMMKHNADIAGELSGHIFFKKNHFKESPVLALLKIMKILDKTGGDINVLIQPFMTWFNSGEINIETKDKQGEMDRIMRVTEEKYADGRLDKLDGVTIEYPSWWFNLRPSNTEPFLRLVVEAKTKNLLNEKAGEVMRIVKA